MWKATLFSSTDPNKECMILLSTNIVNLFKKTAEHFEGWFNFHDEYLENKELQNSWEAWKNQIKTITTQNPEEFPFWTSDEKNGRKFRTDYIPNDETYLLEEFISSYDMKVTLKYIETTKSYGSSDADAEVIVIPVYEH